MTRIALIVPAMLFLAAAIVLGGAASAGAYANAAIQLAAALGIALAIVSRASYPGGTQRGLILLMAGTMALALVQLVPLPASLWTLLPGRQVVVETYRLAGIVPPMRPLSLVPDATIGAALALLPAIAAALIGMRAPRIGLALLFATVIVAMIASAALGLAQRAGGLTSTLYIYDVTNRGEAVGFFANSNHLSTLCALAIPAATALFVARQGATRPGAAWLLLGAIVAFALLGIGASNSLAGFGLALIALLSIYPIARLRRGSGTVRRGIAAAIVAGALVIGAIALALVWGHIAGGAVGAGDDMGRAALWQNTVRGIAATIPLGSGLGTFPSVYPLFEDARIVTRVFANHAHNDYLETLLTGGLPALALMLAFGIWWVRTAMAIWLDTTRNAFAEAATVVTGLVLLHELVDYPLRTAAIAVIFGLCCGVMARPRRIVEPDAKPARAGRHVSA